MPSTEAPTMKRSSKTAKPREPAPGDWVAHAPAAPEEIKATAATLKEVQRILEAKEIKIDAVEVYQIPSSESWDFAGGGELLFESDAG